MRPTEKLPLIYNGPISQDQSSSLLLMSNTFET